MQVLPQVQLSPQTSPTQTYSIEYTYILLVLFIICAIYYLTKQPKFNPPALPPKLTLDLTLQQLSQYNGTTKPQTFLAAKGTIYDVTNSPFYSKDGAYGLFAGKDASVNLAKMSHDEGMLNKWGHVKLNQDEQKVLDDWVGRFQQKYRVVGVVKPSQ